ncbi:MAG: OpgC domain-containing protein [Steroidobacteraceae bacterium]
MTRRNELDSMRGILLVLMAFTHLPTGLSRFANQPLGFVSAAEGFVFLSAFLVGSIYTPLLLERGIGFVRTRIWKRTRHLYLYHLGLLLFAFTVVAGVAHFGHSPSLHNFLAPFFHSPIWASMSAPLLLYQPPLMDILPMYIVFLGLTPVVLQFAARRGWRPLLIASALMWIAAQLQVGRGLYGLLAAGGYPLPHDAWSSFDWFAWQLVWIGGLWLGSSGERSASATSDTAPSKSRHIGRGVYVLMAAVGAAALLLCARHHVGGLVSGLDSNTPLTSKWHLGPLRVANFAVLAYIAHRLLLPLLHWLRIGWLELLGRSSLQVFTAHIPVCILADGLLLGAAPVSLPLQSALLALTLGVMLAVAWRTDTPRRRARTQRDRPGDRREQPAAAPRVSVSRPVSVMSE